MRNRFVRPVIGARPSWRLAARRTGRSAVPVKSADDEEFYRLRKKFYAIDPGIYSLGSCTMKHNPWLNEVLVRLPGCAQIHPLQLLSTV